MAQAIPAVCVRCGATAPAGPPLTWTAQTADRGRAAAGPDDGDVEHLCATCSRENLRAIEGRLDAAWW